MSVAEQIVNKEADYLLALKNNNKTLYEQVKDWMQSRKEHFDIEKHIDFGSGRIETRTCYVCKDLTFLEDLAHWKGIILVRNWIANKRRENLESSEEITHLYIA